MNYNVLEHHQVMAVRVKMFAYHGDIPILEAFVMVFAQPRAKKTIYIVKLRLILLLDVPNLNNAFLRQLMLMEITAPPSSAH